ncbi:NUDIX domain-containing protein, partial [Mariniblastus sp.]|nr:NUDIX domain-containing protein [Mariniblastus sp.]
CAYRELEEETGIRAEHVLMDEHFKFKNKYVVKYDENGGVIKKKKLIIYLAKLLEPVEIKPTEHEGFEWVSWTPPHQIQKKTIDPLLHHLAEHWNSIGDRVRGSV